MAQLLPLLEPCAVKMASVIGARSSSLHCRLSEDMQTQFINAVSLLLLCFVLSICRRFAIFVSIDG
jgi:hypothetical protein